MIKYKNSEKKITNHLQQDVVKVSGKTIFINPFLYWRRFDENTNRWLREPGQMSEDQINPNRNRFYPEIEWTDLSHEQKLIRDNWKCISGYLKKMVFKLLKKLIFYILMERKMKSFLIIN